MSSVQSTVDYSTEVAACEGTGDWLRCFELYVEANALKVELSSAALQATTRTFAEGGQWQRALDVYKKLQQRGEVEAVSASTINTLVAAIAKAEQGLQAEELLTQVCQAAGLEEPQAGAVSQSSTDDSQAQLLTRAALQPAYAATVRALARQGYPDRAMMLLEKLVLKHEIRLSPDVFAAVAIAYMKNNQVEKSDEVIELRDYM